MHPLYYYIYIKRGGKGKVMEERKYMEGWWVEGEWILARLFFSNQETGYFLNQLLGLRTNQRTFFMFSLFCYNIKRGGGESYGRIKIYEQGNDFWRAFSNWVGIFRNFSNFSQFFAIFVNMNLKKLLYKLMISNQII